MSAESENARPAGAKCHVAKFQSPSSDGTASITYGLVDEFGIVVDDMRYMSREEAEISAVARGVVLDESYEGIDYWILSD